MDSLDDLFAQPVKAARPGGRFQPKAKPKPPAKKAAPTSVSASSTTHNVTEPVKNAEPSSNMMDGEFIVDESKSASLAHEKDFTEDIIDKANDSSQPNLDTVREEHATSAGQNADTFTGLESIDALRTESTTTDLEGAVPRFDAESINISSPDNIGQFDVPEFSDLTNTYNVAEEVLINLQGMEEGDPLTASRFDGGVSMNDKGCEREEMHALDSTDFYDTTTTPGQRAEKFQPKRKVQMQKEVPVVSSMESDPNPPEINSSEKDSFQYFIGDGNDDVIDLSSIELNDGAPNEETSEPLWNEESMNQTKDVPECPAKLVSRREKVGTNEAHVASNGSGQQQNACSSGQDNESTDRVLRPRKKKVRFSELDEAEDPQVNELSDEHPASSAADEGGNCDDEQLEQERASKVKRKRRKSTKPDEDKEKQSKKQKKAKKSDVKPKKFSHSTRRKPVNKTLLSREANEEEIDYSQETLGDLIRLAEHKEKQMNKKDATAQPATKQSNGDSSASHHENETFASQEDEEDNNEQEPEAKVQDMNYFNYHTYMKKTPTIRWSKQDTELFYEAVRQFGTDLSMIQHLFPGRTRHQIKLKYKKEERQNPFRLHDAFTTRTKDVSHFQKVIDRLKEIAAEEKQNADEDEEIGLSGDEAEEQETPLPNDEEAKPEETEKEKKEDVPEDVQETGNPEDQESDEEYDWSNYKSEV